MRGTYGIILVFGSLAMHPCCAQSPPLIIDGELHDWVSIEPALIDPMDAADAAVDLGEMRIAHTKSHVHLLIDFGRTVNAQGLDGTAMMLLDADGDPATGQRESGLDGVDVIIDLSPRDASRPERPGMGMGVRSTTYFPDPADPGSIPPSVYDIGLMFAPTYAARRIEFRLDRGAKLPNTPAMFNGERFAMKTVFIDMQGNIADETAVITHDLREGESPLPSNEDAIDPLMRPSSTNIRVMNWNVWRGANFTNPDPFARTIVAIKPDVILLQELPESATQAQLQEFLARATQSNDWNVVFGTGGGDLRCAIAARVPMQDALQSLPMTDQPDRTVRAVGAIIENEGKRLLVVAVHLRCCGRAGGPEDQQRLIEVRILSEAISAVVKDHDIDGIVIAGDFNLVGSRDPIEVMAAGLDLDHTTLHIAHPLCLDGLSHVTWADPKQPFAPGRLDFLLYSDSHLVIDRSFVYDSRHLSERWLAHHSVRNSDSSDASDHRPVVADLRWSDGSPQRDTGAGEVRQ